MKTDVKRSVLGNGIKAGLLAFVISCIGVLLLALAAKMFGISENVLPIANQVIKVLAVLIASIIFLKEDKLAIKAIVCALTFWLASLVLFCILGGKLQIGQLMLDLVISLVVSFAVAVIKNRRA